MGISAYSVLLCAPNMWRRFQKFGSSFFPALVFLLYLVVVVCLLNRWDSMVAITLPPLWTWTVVGVLASLLSWILFRGGASIVVLVIWLVTAVLFSEETHSLVRELAETVDPKPLPHEDERIRVANLNAGSKAEALDAAVELAPDILVVQEAPGEEAIAATTRELFGVEGTYLIGNNSAILARGEILDTIVEPESNAIHARLRIEEGFVIDITGVEMQACIPRLSLWSADTWKELSDLRMRNRRQLRTHLGENEITRDTTGRIISGGFQTPPGDDVFRPLESNELLDSFAKTGLGWGNTYPAEYPILRLDQIWTSENLPPVRSVAVPNPESDHRIVVSDLRLPPAAEES